MKSFQIIIQSNYLKKQLHQLLNKCTYVRRVITTALGKLVGMNILKHSKNFSKNAKKFDEKFLYF